ncbi:MAG TPA: serine hydrolase domain-containing protein [Pseudonocardiaceae bacterium]|nr:serine hydrolase domain-containing protein [Pseudonocardiaceae bacterium]
MSWTSDAERSLAERFTAVAAVDRSGTVVTDVDRVFEIGSVTKTMTASVLALLVGEGVLGLDDEISRWLSAGPNGSITVRQLATHTSGLPSMAPGRHSWDGYTFQRAEADLRRVVVGSPRYSNLGFQLLGLILERASGVDYRALVTSRLLVPLGMAASTFGDEYPLGAGGVEATIDDLSRYARACLFPPSSALGSAIVVAQEQGLGWVRTHGVCEHSGGTRGCSGCVSVDSGRGRAVAILTDEPGGPARSDYLKRVARVVLAGGDPGRVAELVPWAGWRDEVVAVARDFVAGRVDLVHARLVAGKRSTVSVAQLAAAWAARGGGGGGEIVVGEHSVAATGAVVVDLVVGVVRLRVAVLPGGEIGGLGFPEG